jgi:hypothetical protein
MSCPFNLIYLKLPRSAWWARRAMGDVLEDSQIEKIIRTYQTYRDNVV